MFVTRLRGPCLVISPDISFMLGGLLKSHCPNRRADLRGGMADVLAPMGARYVTVLDGLPLSYQPPWIIDLIQIAQWHASNPWPKWQTRQERSFQERSFLFA
jgi:hypothetical protein